MLPALPPGSLPAPERRVGMVTQLGKSHPAKCKRPRGYAIQACNSCSIWFSELPDFLGFQPEPLPLPVMKVQILKYLLSVLDTLSAWRSLTCLPRPGSNCHGTAVPMF